MKPKSFQCVWIGPECSLSAHIMRPGQQPLLSTTKSLLYIRASCVYTSNDEQIFFDNLHILHFTFAMAYADFNITTSSCHLNVNFLIYILCRPSSSGFNCVRIWEWQCTAPSKFSRDKWHHRPLRGYNILSLVTHYYYNLMWE